MMNIHLHSHFSKVSLAAAVLLIGGLFVILYSVQQNQEQRSRAGANSVQAQCSPSGKVQFAISYTNTQSYTVNLTVKSQTQEVGVNKEYPSIASGEAKMDIIDTDKVSVLDGNMDFTSLPNDPNSTESNVVETKPYTALDCSPVPTISSALTPALDISPTSSLSPTLVLTPTSAFTPTSGISPTIPVPTPTLTVIGSPAGSKTAADLTDDGNVNQFDYNLFLREISNLPGQ